jgi:hypothetical protein
MNENNLITETSPYLLQHRENLRSTMNGIRAQLLCILSLSIFWISNANAYFGDEFDLAVFPNGTKVMTALQLGSAGMLKSKKITSTTTLNEIINQEFLISANLNNNFNIGFSLKHGKTGMERNTHPKTIDTRAQNYRFWLGSKPWQKWQWRSYLNYQVTDLIQLQCYAMASRIVGGNCDDAEYRFLNPDKTMNDDGSLNTVPVLKTKVQANVIGFELRRELISTDNIRVASQVRLQSARIEHDISSPLFTMRSPVLLDFKVNGKSLRQLRDEFRSELPQTNPWYEHNISIGIKGARTFQETISIEAGIAYTKIARNDYIEHPLRHEVTDNFRLDVSLIWATPKDSALYLKGFATTHNTLGYEPITYNRKSSSQFNKKYGEVAIGFIKFW